MTINLTPDLTQVSVREEALVDPRTGAPRKQRFVTVNRAEKWWIDKARVDPAFFIHYLSGMEPAKHHRWWLANIFHPQRQRINIIAPRDSAKSTVAVYAMAFYLGKYPITTNGIISVSSDQAQDRQRMLRSIMVNNPRFKNVFPHVHLDTRLPDTQEEFSLWSSEGGRSYNNWRRLVTRYGSLKDPTIYVSGLGGKASIGNRLSGILLLDDIIDEHHLSTKAQDDVDRSVMQTLIPTVKEEGRVVNIGTRWMLNDWPERLKNNPEWYTIEIAATLYDAAGNRHSYWPKYWPLRRLDKKRREMNNDALYFIMYENDPRALTHVLFTEPQLRVNLPPILPRFVELYVSCDLAISLKEAADFNVIQGYGIDAERNVYLLNQMRFKASVDQIVNNAVNFANDLAMRYGLLTGVLVENVAFQAVFMQLFNAKDRRLPIVGVVPRGDKAHRANLVSDWSRRGKFFINQSMPDIEQLISEWMNFPLHKNDDTLDPASLLFQHLNVNVIGAEVQSVTSPYLL